MSPALERRIRAAAGCLLIGWASGCVDVPDPIDRDGQPALNPTDGPVDGVSPPADRGAVDSRPGPTDMSRRDARPADGALRDAGVIDRGPTTPRDAQPMGADASGLACADGGVPAPNLGVCVHVAACRPVPGARIGHRVAVMTSGRVLLVGGGAALPEGTGLEEATWLYDPADDTWSAAGDLGERLHRHSLTALPDEQAFVVGGDTAPEDPADAPQSETYLIQLPRSPQDQNRGWQRPGNSRHRHARHAAAWIDDQLVVSGGLVSDRILGDFSFGDSETWDADDGWDREPAGEPPLYDHRIRVLADGTPLLFGGEVLVDGERMTVPNSTIYAMRDGGWQAESDGVAHVSGPAVDTPAGVLLVGGVPLRLSALRRLSVGGADPLVDMSVVREGPAAARIGPGSVVMILGGEIAGALDTTVDLIDVATGVRDAIRLPDVDLGVWAHAQAVTLRDGDALFVGGLDGLGVSDRCVRARLIGP